MNRIQGCTVHRVRISGYFTARDKMHVVIQVCDTSDSEVLNEVIIELNYLTFTNFLEFRNNFYQVKWPRA